MAASGEVRVGDGLDPELADTVMHKGGEYVAYAGHPLFYFAQDEAGGPPQGHGIHTYGGWWQLIGPTGDPIEDEVLPVK